MGSVMHDLRYAVRSLRGRPGLALAVVLTLGPGLGGAIVVFDVVNLLAWQPPPVERPGELVEVYSSNPQGQFGVWGPTSYPDYADYREASAGLVELAATTGLSVVLEAEEWSGRVGTHAVSGNYFELLGTNAAAGRLLGPGDDRAGSSPAVALSFGMWHRVFGGDPEWIGRSVVLDGRTFRIVGVVSEAFAGTRVGSTSDLYIPLAHFPRTGPADWMGDRSLRRFFLLGRLRPGQSAAAVEARLAVRAAALDREHPLPALERRITVLPATRVHPAERHEMVSTVQLLSAAMGLLLLIACANVAQLLLARSVSRRREMGIRRALGAGRVRLLRQVLAESGLLALLGALWGLFLAAWARSFLAAHIGEELAGELRFDHRVLGLAFAACLVATLLCALAPALVQARADLVASLKSGSTGKTGPGPGLAPILVGAQVALSALLLATTALVGLSLWNLRSTDPGFETENLAYARVWAWPKRMPDLGRDFYRRATEHAASLPGVLAVGRAQLLPPVGSEVATRFRLQEAEDPVRVSQFNVVDGGYFAALDIPLVAGRAFDGRDGADGRPVVVVNQTLADELWPEGDALGRTIWAERGRPWDPEPAFEVVGVVASIRHRDPRQAEEGVLYFSYEQRYRPILELAVRTAGDPAPVMAALRDGIRALDPQLERLEIRTYADHVWGNLGRERLLTQALGTFAFVGWFLAVVGVAGVTSYAVSREVRDIGIRMALGARGRDVLVQVLGRGLRLAAAGLVLGLGGSLGTAHLLRHLLFGVTAGDPAILAAVSLVVFASAASAAWVPARRASRVDPLHALRQE